MPFHDRVDRFPLSLCSSNTAPTRQKGESTAKTLGERKALLDTPRRFLSGLLLATSIAIASGPGLFAEDQAIKSSIGEILEARADDFAAEMAAENLRADHRPRAWLLDESLVATQIQAIAALEDDQALLYASRMEFFNRENVVPSGLLARRDLRASLEESEYRLELSLAILQDEVLPDHLEKIEFSLVAKIDFSLLIDALDPLYSALTGAGEKQEVEVLEEHANEVLEFYLESFRDLWMIAGLDSVQNLVECEQSVTTVDRNGARKTFPVATLFDFDDWIVPANFNNHQDCLDCLIDCFIKEAGDLAAMTATCLRNRTVQICGFLCPRAPFLCVGCIKGVVAFCLLSAGVEEVRILSKCYGNCLKCPLPEWTLPGFGAWLPEPALEQIETREPRDCKDEECLFCIDTSVWTQGEEPSGNEEPALPDGDPANEKK